MPGLKSLEDRIRHLFGAVAFSEAKVIDSARNLVREQRERLMKRSALPSEPEGEDEPARARQGENMVDENPVIFQNNRNQYLAGVVHVPREFNNPPLLVMAHGFTDDKVGDNRLFVRFARRGRERGYAVLRFDFAGSGDSEGEFADMTVTREIEDLESAVDFAKNIPCLAESPVYLIGYSLGAAIALSFAAADIRVRGVVCWSPASDLESLFAKILGHESFMALQRGGEVACRNDSKQFVLKSGFFDDLNYHDPVREIAKVSPRPVLLIQGTADVKVLPGQTEALFRAAEHPKEMCTIDSAPHSFAFHEEELFGATLRRLDSWTRDARYAADFRDGEGSKDSTRPTGRA